MNTLESHNTQVMSEVEEVCAKFVIDTTDVPFVLHNITQVGQEYALSLWIKADTSGSVIINGVPINVTTAWARHIFTFTATDVNVNFIFTTLGNYYIYHPKLEIGNKATDWTPNPDDMASNEDVSEAVNNAKDDIGKRLEQVSLIIDDINNQISTLVSGENGETQLVQTDTGWTFNIKSVNDAVQKIREDLGDLTNITGSTSNAVDDLKKSVTKLDETAAYVRIVEYETEPCIELGKESNDYRVLITNTRIMFMKGNDNPTYIDTTGLVTENITINSELRQGGNWLWKKRASGNYGLQWKAVTS